MTKQKTLEGKEAIQHEMHPLDAEGYVRLRGPCGSTRLQLAKPIDYSKEPDCIRYFKCWRCKRKVDRAKENMWTWAPNQVLGLAVPMHSYCWGCYQIVRKGGKGLGGITGREFANVASEVVTDRRRGFGKMNEATAVDMNVICAYCGRPKVVCRCGCTANSGVEIEYSREGKWCKERQL